MKPPVSLPAKILLLAFLNVVLLGLVFFVFARIQFRFDLGSFLLSPARDRMVSVSRLVALQLPNSPRSSWNQVLEQFSASYPAEFYLFDSEGDRLAGKAVTLPPDLMQAIRSDPFANASHAHVPSLPPPNRAERSRSLFFTTTAHPAQHWVGVHVPVWTAGLREPIHGTLVWRFPSLWTNPFFFDYKPWLAVVLAVVVVCVICWLPLIRGLTRSIAQLTGVTSQIADGNFDVELPATRRDELGKLSESIGRMAHRLSGLVHGQKRFLGDIAHELCSPLARIQLALGILEQRAQSSDIEYVADAREEVQHMSGLVNELLSFSKAQINTEADLAKVNLAETVRRVVQREASEKAQVQTQVDERLAVTANPDYLFRALSNVMRNAIRYAGEAGPIVVSAKNGSGGVAITIADSGPGVPDSELEEIFKPFYRPEFARQRETGGAGLGLAIVKSCIEACGGSVACRNRSPKGLEVEMRLPAAQE
jgi:two-component system sensor histidine kinase CpxA